MAESAGGRYRQALEALAEYLPLLVVELRIWRGAGEAIIVPETVIANGSLDIAGPAGRVGGQERTRDDWVAEASEEALEFVEEFVRWTQETLGEVRVDYTPQSYIGVRRGRRVWAPLWLRSDGAMVYLPDPDDSREEQASVAFDYFVERLGEVGLEPSWQRTYNAGANPIALRLRMADMHKEPVQELLRASFEILDAGTSRYSERHPMTAAPSEPAPGSPVAPEAVIAHTTEESGVPGQVGPG
jgi:hypothetical protein